MVDRNTDYPKPKYQNPNLRSLWGKYQDQLGIFGSSLAKPSVLIKSVTQHAEFRDLSPAHQPIRNQVRYR